METGHNEEIGDFIQVGEETPVSVIGKNTEQHIMPDTAIEDIDNANIQIEDNGRISTTTLSGTAMFAYEIGALKDKRIVHKRGAEPDDNMSHFYEWLENEGIHLQQIIDYELPQIIKKKPDTKIKFMRIRPTSNSTHDEYMKTHLMLVIDHTDTVKTIHKEENGGVIQSGDKKYLVVGTVGFGNKNNTSKFNLYRLLNDANLKEGHRLPTKAWTWFNQQGNEAERFYVDPDIYTEIKPYSMIPGYVIKQLETDAAPKLRRISELIADERRNPHGLTLENMPWMIQFATGNVLIKANFEEVMKVQDMEANTGRVFALVPAGNGKKVAIALRQLRYADERFNREGALGKRIDGLLNQLIAPKVEDRVAAVVDLLPIFLMGHERNQHNILISKDGKAITFVRESGKRTIHEKDGGFDVSELMEAVREWNPIINITGNILSNLQLLQEYDEAGALMTDAALLGTAGVSYDIYAVDEAGNMLGKEEKAVFRTPQNKEKDFEKPVIQVPYEGGRYYTYDNQTHEFKLDGVKIEDPATLESLEFALQIQQGQKEAVMSYQGWDYFVLSEGEHPEVVRRHNGTKKIEKVGEKQARKIIQEAEDKKDRIIRGDVVNLSLDSRKEANAEKTQESSSSQQEDREIVGSPESEITSQESGDMSESKENNNAEESTIGFVENSTVNLLSENGLSETSSGETPTNTVTLVELLNDDYYGGMVRIAIQSKWPNASTDNVRTLMDLLKKRGINTETIDGTDAGIDAWLHTIECL